MPIGDSITIGVSGGYRNDVYTKLTAKRFEVDMVGTANDEWTEVEDKDHESFSGATFTNADYYLEEWLAAITAPDVVLVMLGTNDLAWWTAVGPEGTRDQMLVFVDHLRKQLPDAILILCTIPPQTPGNVEPINLDRAEMTKTFNTLLKSALDARPDRGSSVFVADVNAVLTLDDLYDGFHPTREAHTKIGNVIVDVMDDLLPAAP
jgi:lysophospholipase L1-like esterase